jgi:hypothetical protein
MCRRNTLADLEFAERMAGRPLTTLILSLLLSAAACSGDEGSVLEDACRVVVEDCGNGDSVGACVDALGDQYDDCLACIADTGCTYVSACTRETASCALPGAYAPP